MIARRNSPLRIGSVFLAWRDGTELEESTLCLYEKVYGEKNFICNHSALLAL